MPTVNWLLMIAAITLVLVFRSSGNLAAAYGVAVNSTMAVTTILAYNVARERGGWGLWSSLAFLVGFLAIDLGFLGANLRTIPEGGWLPLLTGAMLFTVMTTWRSGSNLLAEHITNITPTMETFIGRVKAEGIPRVPGVAVFFTGRLDHTPPALQQLAASTGVVHERVILVRVMVEPVPKTEADERIELAELDEGFNRLLLRYGFMQGPNIPSDLAACVACGLEVNLDEIRYFTGHVDMLAGRKSHGMVLWRDRLFVRMAANTQDVTAHYQIPAAQVMQVGLQVGI
jgi:KUP system potassium uptake protein